MGRKLRVLLVEDSEDDALLMMRHLRSSGLDVDAVRVQTADEMSAAISTDSWDVVLCDYRMPGFDGMGALRIMQASGLDVPFVIVSGAIGEEVAAAAMRAGAHDFVSKGNLARLGPAVQRELAEADVRRSHRAAEKALRGSEERYRTLMANLPVGVFRAEPGGTIVSANPALAAMLGCAFESEVVGLSAADLCADPRRWNELLEALESAGVVVDFEARLRRRDGDEFWGQLNVRAVAGSGGVQYQDGTIADIDRRRQLEEALKRGKEEWERTFDAVRELILISDEQFRTVRGNRTAAEILGLEVEEMIGRNCYELIYGTDRSPESCPMERIAATGEPGEFYVRRDDLGAELHFSLTPRFDESGELAGIIHVGRDVTDQRRLDEVLRRQEMVVQAEQIFRTFRHEVGNALNTLKTTLTVLRNNYRDFSSEQRETYFKRCLESFRLAEQLLRALRSYQSLDRVHPVPLEVHRFLQEKEGLLFAAARECGVCCKVACCDAPSRIDADPDALVRILLNLVENAVEATTGRENPTIEVSCFSLRGQTALRVRDNGCGIHPDDRPHVFAPLFTTRAEGSGLGLAIVQKLMVQMGGLTTIDSEVDQGCTVELRFPTL